MEIADLKKQIKSGEFDKTYIFCGEEHTIMKIYLNMIADKSGCEISYVDSLMDLMTGAKTKSLVPVHHLYVIMDDKEYLTNEKMWDKFKGLKDDIVVFYYTTTDKRLKFWKQNKDKAVEFVKLDNRILTKYIQKEAPFFTEDMCNELITACENDYGRISFEVDKIRHYCRAEKVKGDFVFRKFMDEGVIYRNPQDAIFDFVAAVLERNPAKAYDLLQQSKAIGEANLTLLSVLYNNIKTLLQVQSGKSWKELGLNGFAVKNVAPFKNNYSNDELVNAMKIIREVETGIKTGKIPDELAVEYFLVQVI